MGEHQHDEQDATDGRPIDPTTGRPAEPFLEGTSEVPEQDPAPGLDGEHADLEDPATSPE